MANWDLLWAVAPFKREFLSSQAMQIDEFLVWVPNWVKGSDHTLETGMQVVLRGGLGLKVTSKIEVPSSAFINVLSGGKIDVLSGGMLYGETGSDVRFLAAIRLAGFGNNGSPVVITDNLDATGHSVTCQDVTARDIGCRKLTPTSQPAATADPGSNTLHASNVPKAWAWIVSDGIGASSILAGHGVASISALGAGVGWAVTMAHAMESPGLYSVVATYQYGASEDGTNVWVPRVKILSQTAFEIRLNKLNGDAVDVTAAAVGVSFHVHGRQT